MPPMKSIQRPDGDLSVENAMTALRPSFDDLIELADIDIQATAGAEMPEECVALARRAGSVGWPLGTALEAIREIARDTLVA